MYRAGSSPSPCFLSGRRLCYRGHFLHPPLQANCETWLCCHAWARELWRKVCLDLPENVFYYISVYSLIYLCRRMELFCCCINCLYCGICMYMLWNFPWVCTTSLLLPLIMSSLQHWLPWAALFQCNDLCHWGDQQQHNAASRDQTWLSDPWLVHISACCCSRNVSASQ